jgi:drug/metabolite transporter (DMT)-like permease
MRGDTLTIHIHPTPQHRDPTGYALVIGSFVIVGLSGTLVSWADAPGSVLLVLRFAVAAAALAAVFARRRPWAGVWRRGLWLKLLLMGVLDAATLLGYFFAIRETGVAASTFLLFLMPVWVALLAPRLLHIRTERIVYVALGVALAGLVVILAPSLSGGALRLSAIGLAIGLGSGICYALFQLLVKGLTQEVASTTIVFYESILNVVFILPLALWQLRGVDLGPRDLATGLILGLVCTALAYTMWTEGLARTKVQHSSILGFLTPVMAPLFAWALLGQTVGIATVVGGALIIVAGVLVTALGREDAEAGTPTA